MGGRVPAAGWTCVLDRVWSHFCTAFSTLAKHGEGHMFHTYVLHIQGVFGIK